MDNFSRIESKRNRTTPALKVLKRASKSYEALQQGFILSLLNTHNYGITFKKPERRSVKTIQSLVVKTLILPNGFCFEYEAELEKHCNRLAEDELRQAKYYALSAHNIESIAEINKIINDGYDIEKLKQIKRHREANRNSIAFNWLVKYAEDIGYNFGRRSSKPAQYTTKMMKITSMLGEDSKVEMNQDVIEYIGIKFNQYVFKQFEKEENELTIKGNDSFVYELVNNHDEVKGTYLKSLYEEELNEANGMSVSTFQMNQNSQNNNTVTTFNNENTNTLDLNQSNGNNVNEYINHINEIKENESNIQSKTITVINGQDVNHLNQSVGEVRINENESNQEITCQNTLFNQLPTLDVTQNNDVDDENNQNEEMQIENQSTTTTQIQENSMEDEKIQYIRDYYDNLAYDENCCYGFIQTYNFY